MVSIVMWLASERVAGPPENQTSRNMKRCVKTQREKLSTMVTLVCMPHLASAGFCQCWWFMTARIQPADITTLVAQHHQHEPPFKLVISALQWHLSSL